MSRLLPFIAASLLLLRECPSTARAADPASRPAPAAAPAPATVTASASAGAGALVATDPSYRLSAGDTITIAIEGEPELAASQTIARAGEVRLPLVGEIILSGKSVREAEHFLERTYQERQFLKTPVVNIVVTAYFPREVSVLGAVRGPGTVVFPRDTTSLDIIEVITRVGGFLPISKTDAVTITRRLPDGKETIFTVDLDDVISGRRRAGRDRADFAIYPGDRIWVPERLF